MPIKNVEFCLILGVQTMMKKTVFIAFLLHILGSVLCAEIFFSGFAGAKFDFDSKKESSDFDPQLKIQSFFAGQLNLSSNTIVHGEFSLKTEDIIENSLFKETPASFQIDELSIIHRQQLLNATNYLSFFVGTYEPIGSDIFLRRQFGIQPISSRITESWLGLAGSIIYPLFGVGGADIVHFDSYPIATGVYIYVNHELDDCYVFNAAYRFACVYRFFTLDITAGIGVPLESSNYDDAFIVVDKVYWRGGFNMLIGNAYTTSLFIQGGISDIPFTKRDEKFEFDEENTYLLFEPRFRGKKCQVDVTAFSLPEDTVKDFIFINDTLGMNINIYTDNLYFKNKMFLFGINASLTFPDKNFYHLGTPTDLFDDYSIAAAPYLELKLFNGELHSMVQVNFTDIMDSDWYKAFKISIGYKSQF